MNIYTRYVSGEHDKQHFKKVEPSDGHIKLRPLSGQFDTTADHTELKNLQFWKDVLPKAAFFSGFDPALFGHILTMLYKNDSTNKICALSFTKFGCSIYENLILDSSSRFWPACQNLTEEHRSSNVRKALAITNLKSFNKLWNNKGSMDINAQWDETNAGSLASTMKLIEKSPTEISEILFSLDLLQESEMPALVVDVLYDSCFSDPKATDENNSLVTLLGNQMDQLFDPLLEYSPQAMEYSYTPPNIIAESPVRETPEIEKVIEELFTVQSNFTMDLVALLQDFIIPLRVHVLADVADTTEGAMKVNTTFPPTIDEVTRINCILNSTLKVAVRYGYTEVFKVLASILPFFYKAFARHQANISSFHARFAKFLKHNRSYAFENQEINAQNYTPKIVENLIVGSLFELPKLKLIIKRLFDLVMSEKLKASNFESTDASIPESINENYRVIIETIDSLGLAEPENMRGSRNSRIFTPSGKLLTELATQWPEELQYGWMHRKVLAVYELKSIMPLPEAKSQDIILIIFSDHLLFLEAAHSLREESNISIPDVLMNSLVNQKPLPKLSNFPKLIVKYWCDVKQVLAKSFKSDGGQNLTFIAYGDNFFHSKNISEKKVSLSFATKSYDGSEKTCKNIIRHVSKAQILHKSSPFHLFKHEDIDLAKFYCAHDIQNYDNEVSKSPLVILLNLNKEKAVELFQENPQIFIILNLSYLNEHTVQILGFDRGDSLNVSEIVSTENLNISLKEIMIKCMNTLFISSELTRVTVEANSGKLEFLVNCLSPGPSKSSVGLISEVNEAETQGKKLSELSQKASQQKLRKEHTPAKMRINENHTFVSRLLDRLRSKQKNSQKQTEKSGNTKRSYVNIPQTGIPRGKKPTFKRLYKPDPVLEEASTVASTVSQDRETAAFQEIKGLELFQYPSNVDEKKGDETQPRVLSNNTVSSSRYTASVDVASNFQFPVIKDLENIAEDASVDPESTGLQRSSNIMGSVRYVPKKENNVSKQRIDVRETDALKTGAADANFVKGTSKQTNQDKSGAQENTEKVLVKSFTETVKTDRSDEIAGHRKQIIKPLLLPLNDKPNPKIELKRFTGDEQEGKPKGFWAKKDSGMKNNTKCTSMKSEETIFSGKAAASVLENINAAGLPSKLHSRYKIYEELPLSIFNSDEEANWTSLTRDSYSNLSAEVQAMQSEIYERKVSLVKNASMQMKPNPQQFETSEDTFSSFEFVSPFQDQTPEETQVPVGKSIYDVEQSSNSSNSEFVDNFIDELDRNFSLRDNVQMDNDLQFKMLDSVNSSKTEISNEKDDNATNNLHTKRSDSCATIQLTGNGGLAMTNSHTSTDEEYFSSQEFSNALEYWSRGAGQEQEHEHEQETCMMTSSSSEKTLMNDQIWLPKKFGSPQPQTTTQWDGSAGSLDLVENYGSIAYLSDILTGQIEI